MLLARFGADGSVVWQLDLGEFTPDDARVTANGFAMTGECRLDWGDETGRLLGSNVLYPVFSYQDSAHRNDHKRSDRSGSLGGD